MKLSENIKKYKFFQALTDLPFVEEIWLYGSRARGDAEERSDIDLAVLCPTADASQWRQVVDIIEEADTLLEIDCIRFDQLEIKSPLRENILKFKKLLYKKP